MFSHTQTSPLGEEPLAVPSGPSKMNLAGATLKHMALLSANRLSQPLVNINSVVAEARLIYRH